MHKLCFPKRSENRATQPMELIHTDICGPMQVESMGGSRYVLMFTDDYSRYTIVYFLKSKEEALPKVKEFVKLVENQTGRHVKKLNIFANKGKKNVEVIMEENTLQRNVLSIVKIRGFFISLQILIVLNKTEFSKD